MFSVPKAAVVFLLACVQFARATITITNFDVVGNGTTTIEWASSDPNTDPLSFTIEIGNPKFNTQFGVGNNIPTSNGKITFQTPSLIPGPNYSIHFVDNNNASDIIATTPDFTVTEHDVSSSTQAQLSGTTSIPLTSLSGSLAQSTVVSTPGGGVGSSNGPSATTPSPLPTNTSPSNASGSSTSAAATVFGGSGGNSGGALGLNVPATFGVSAATFLAGLAAIILV
jgi:hypothetical protein